MVETREGSLFPFGKWKAILWSPIRRNYRGQRDKPSSNPTFSIIRLIPVGCADGKARTLKRSESNYSIWVGVYRSPGDWTRDEDSPSWLLVLSTRMEQRITIIAWIATFGSMPTPNYTAPDYADIPARTLLSLQFQSGWMWPPPIQRERHGDA